MSFFLRGFLNRRRSTGHKSTSRQRAESILLVMTVLVCPCLVCLGLAEAWHSWRLAAEGERVDGRVEQVHVTFKRMIVVVRLADAEETELRLRSTRMFRWWSMPGYRAGDQVQVYWLPGKKPSARLSLVPEVAIAGLVAVLLTSVLLWRHFRSARKWEMGEW